jgi:hypothetical protein
MRLLTSALFLGLSFSAFAQLSVSEQTALVENIAKNDRRNMWRGGGTDVSSLVSRPTKIQIDELIRDNKDLEYPINKDQIATVYSCHYRPATCVVYIIDLFGAIYGGSGWSRRWVFLHPTTRKYRSSLTTVDSQA